MKAVTRFHARELQLKSWKTRFDEKLERMHGLCVCVRACEGGMEGGRKRYSERECER